MKFTMSATGFVLIACAMGLFIWAGYEMSLIVTGYYDRADRATVESLLGVVLITAVVMALGGRLLRRAASRRRWRPR